MSAVIPENTKNSTNSFLADRKLKLRERTEESDISECRVLTILHEHLSKRKLCSMWVLHLLKVDQKQLRVDDSERYLQLFQRNKKELLRKYVIMDETWIYHFTPVLNQLSFDRKVAGESRPKRPKTQTSSGKILASVFWDAQSIFFLDYLEKRRTANSKYYIAF